MTALVLPSIVSLLWRGYPKNAIPPFVGATNILSSCMTAFKLQFDATKMFRKAYSLHGNGVFRLPAFSRWTYLISGGKYIAEVASAPEHIVSFNEGLADVLQTDWTIGRDITENAYHTPAIRAGLRNLSLSFPQMHDELVHAFDTLLALNNNEWKLITVVPSVTQIISRITARVFVGLPLCRNKEYLDLTSGHNIRVFAASQILRICPDFLKPIIAPIITTRKSAVRHALTLLGPMIEERLEIEREVGRDWPDRPNDLVSWLLDFAEGDNRTPEALVRRILTLNLAAHNTWMSMTAALYDLAKYPEYVLPLREEAERVVAEQGWTRTSISNMHKTDSFLRESQRLSASGPIGMARQVVAKNGFTFSDGTTLPYGSFLSVPGHNVNSDPAVYEKPELFDGFRFSRMREERENGSRTCQETSIFTHHMVTTSPNHVVYGHGRHACPGRFFAALQLKTALAHILINYDVKAETEGVRPPDHEFSLFKVPNTRGQIYIRKRV
ncbi:cytochrome P450 [Mycena galopus ATCC 62051]|nr:cytochrome P450 [Mycena galopus ATCC 62051]